MTTLLAWLAIAALVAVIVASLAGIMRIHRDLENQK